MKDNFSTPGFLWPLLTFACIAVILYGLYLAISRAQFEKNKKRIIMISAVIGFAIWVTLLAILSIKGFFAHFNHLPPRPVLAMLFPLPFILYFSFSATGTQILRTTPPQWLIFMQSFRIFVEVLIWFAVLAEKLPTQMSFEGRNFDILSGVLALAAGYLISKKGYSSRRVIIGYNVIGLLLLLNILIVALLSMPTSIRYFMNEPSAELVAQFPFILLPGVLVPIAYSFHIFSLRQLQLRNKPIVSSKTSSAELHSDQNR